MPIDFVGFTADRRISGKMPLADDRLSDMLNSVSRIVLRDATVGDLFADGASVRGDVTLQVGDLVAVVGAGRRGSESQRRRTAVRQVSIGLGRYVVSGGLHIPTETEDLPRSLDPRAVLAGRDILVPITEASISYESDSTATTEEHETLLINRARAEWIEIVDLNDPGGDEVEVLEDPHGRMNYTKDFTGSVAD
jgi:hypothetical protein